MFDDVCISPDRQIGKHSHLRWELSHVICGAGTRTIGDLTEPMKEGEIILIPPDFMRRHAGKSLSEFVNGIRLERAMEMLRHTDKNISDIAYDTGFANVTYFNRLFRNKYNRTPRSVRTKNDNDTD